jgi:hypothetical protein
VNQSVVYPAFRWEVQVFQIIEEETKELNATTLSSFAGTNKVCAIVIANQKITFVSHTLYRHIKHTRTQLVSVTIKP